MSVAEVAAAIRRCGGRVRGEVWYCDDDFCNCSQAELVHITPNPLAPGWVYRDLQAFAEALREHDPASFERVEWVR